MRALTLAAQAVIPGWAIAGSIWSGLSVICLVLAIWFGLEAATYFLKEPQITPFVRHYVNSRPIFTFVGMLALVAGGSAAVTHFWLDR